MADVRLVELTKHYKRGGEVIRALDGVTMDIHKGEFVAVVGRSGSGKTTMLDLMGLLLKPTSGSLFIDDALPFRGTVYFDTAALACRIQRWAVARDPPSCLAAWSTVETRV